MLGGIVELEARLSIAKLQQDIDKLERAFAKQSIEITPKLNSDNLKLPKEFENALVIKVDDTALTKLNEHLDLKDKHYKEVKANIENNPLQPNGDISENNNIQTTNNNENITQDNNVESILSDKNLEKIEVLIANIDANIAQLVNTSTSTIALPESNVGASSLNDNSGILTEIKGINQEILASVNRLNNTSSGTQSSLSSQLLPTTKSLQSSFASMNGMYRAASAISGRMLQYQKMTASNTKWVTLLPMLFLAPLMGFGNYLGGLIAKGFQDAQVERGGRNLEALGGMMGEAFGIAEKAVLDTSVRILGFGETFSDLLYSLEAKIDNFGDSVDTITSFKSFSKLEKAIGLTLKGILNFNKTIFKTGLATVHIAKRELKNERYELIRKQRSEQVNEAVGKILTQLEKEEKPQETTQKDTPLIVGIGGLGGGQLEGFFSMATSSDILTKNLAQAFGDMAEIISVESKDTDFIGTHHPSVAPITAAFKMLGNMSKFTGAKISSDALNIVMTVLKAKMEDPNRKTIITGYSAGSMAVIQAIQILQKLAKENNDQLKAMRLDEIEGLTIGGPTALDVTEEGREKVTSFLGAKDPVATATKLNSMILGIEQKPKEEQILPEVAKHSPPSYLISEKVAKKFEQLLGIKVNLKNINPNLVGINTDQKIGNRISEQLSDLFVDFFNQLPKESSYEQKFKKGMPEEEILKELYENDKKALLRIPNYLLKALQIIKSETVTEVKTNLTKPTITQAGTMDVDVKNIREALANLVGYLDMEISPEAWAKKIKEDPTGAALDIANLSGITDPTFLKDLTEILSSGTNLAIKTIKNIGEKIIGIAGITAVKTYVGIQTTRKQQKIKDIAIPAVEKEVQRIKEEDASRKPRKHKPLAPLAEQIQNTEYYKDLVMPFARFLDKSTLAQVERIEKEFGIKVDEFILAAGTYSEETIGGVGIAQKQLSPKALRESIPDYPIINPAQKIIQNPDSANLIARANLFKMPRNPLIPIIKDELKGFTEDAIQLAAEAIVLLEKGIKVHLKSFSGGGYAVLDAVKILNQMGYEKEVRGTITAVTPFAAENDLPGNVVLYNSPEDKVTGYRQGEGLISKIANAIGVYADNDLNPNIGATNIQSHDLGPGGYMDMILPQDLAIEKLDFSLLLVEMNNILQVVKTSNLLNKNQISEIIDAIKFVLPYFREGLNQAKTKGDTTFVASGLKIYSELNSFIDDYHDLIKLDKFTKKTKKDPTWQRQIQEVEEDENMTPIDRAKELVEWEALSQAVETATMSIQQIVMSIQKAVETATMSIKQTVMSPINSRENRESDRYRIGVEEYSKIIDAIAQSVTEDLKNSGKTSEVDIFLVLLQKVQAYANTVANAKDLDDATLIEFIKTYNIRKSVDKESQGIGDYFEVEEIRNLYPEEREKGEEDKTGKIPPLYVTKNLFHGLELQTLHKETIKPIQEETLNLIKKEIKELEDISIKLLIEELATKKQKDPFNTDELVPPEVLARRVSDTDYPIVLKIEDIQKQSSQTIQEQILQSIGQKIKELDDSSLQELIEDRFITKEEDPSAVEEDPSEVGDLMTPQEFREIVAASPIDIMSVTQSLLQPIPELLGQTMTVIKDSIGEAMTFTQDSIGQAMTVSKDSLGNTLPVIVDSINTVAESTGIGLLLKALNELKKTIQGENTGKSAFEQTPIETLSDLRIEVVYEMILEDTKKEKNIAAFTKEQTKVAKQIKRLQTSDNAETPEVKAQIKKLSTYLKLINDAIALVNVDNFKSGNFEIREKEFIPSGYAEYNQELSTTETKETRESIKQKYERIENDKYLTKKEKDKKKEERSQFLPSFKRDLMDSLKYLKDQVNEFGNIFKNITNSFESSMLKAINRIATLFEDAFGISKTAFNLDETPQIEVTNDKKNFLGLMLQELKGIKRILLNIDLSKNFTENESDAKETTNKPITDNIELTSLDAFNQAFQNMANQLIADLQTITIELDSVKLEIALTTFLNTFKRNINAFKIDLEENIKKLKNAFSKLANKPNIKPNIKLDNIEATPITVSLDNAIADLRELTIPLDITEVSKIQEILSSFVNNLESVLIEILVLLEGIDIKVPKINLADEVSYLETILETKFKHLNENLTKFNKRFSTEFKKILAIFKTELIAEIKKQSIKIDNTQFIGSFNETIDELRTVSIPLDTANMSKIQKEFNDFSERLGMVLADNLSFLKTLEINIPDISLENKFDDFDAILETRNKAFKKNTIDFNKQFGNTISAFETLLQKAVDDLQSPLSLDTNNLKESFDDFKNNIVELVNQLTESLNNTELKIENKETRNSFAQFIRLLRNTIRQERIKTDFNKEDLKIEFDIDPQIGIFESSYTSFVQMMSAEFGAFITDLKKVNLGKDIPLIPPDLDATVNNLLNLSVKLLEGLGLAFKGFTDTLVSILKKNYQALTQLFADITKDFQVRIIFKLEDTIRLFNGLDKVLDLDGIFKTLANILSQNLTKLDSLFVGRFNKFRLDLIKDLTNLLATFTKNLDILFNRGVKVSPDKTTTQSKNDTPNEISESIIENTQPDLVPYTLPSENEEQAKGYTIESNYERGLSSEIANIKEAFASLKSKKMVIDLNAFLKSLILTKKGLDLFLETINQGVLGFKKIKPSGKDLDSQIQKFIERINSPKTTESQGVAFQKIIKGELPASWEEATDDINASINSKDFNALPEEEQKAFIRKFNNAFRVIFDSLKEKKAKVVDSEDTDTKIKALVELIKSQASVADLFSQMPVQTPKYYVDQQQNNLLDLANIFKDLTAEGFDLPRILNKELNIDATPIEESIEKLITEQGGKVFPSDLAKIKTILLAIQKTLQTPKPEAKPWQKVISPEDTAREYKTVVEEKFGKNVTNNESLAPLLEDVLTAEGVNALVQKLDLTKEITGTKKADKITAIVEKSDINKILKAFLELQPRFRKKAFKNIEIPEQFMLPTLTKEEILGKQELTKQINKENKLSIIDSRLQLQQLELLTNPLKELNTKAFDDTIKEITIKALAKSIVNLTNGILLLKTTIKNNPNQSINRNLGGQIIQLNWNLQTFISQLKQNSIYFEDLIKEIELKTDIKLDINLEDDPQKIIDKLISSFDQAYQYNLSLNTDDIKEGLNNLQTELAIKGKESAKTFNTEFEDEEGISSPSKVWQYYGQMLVKGLQKGLLGSEKTGKDVAKKVNTAFKTEEKINSPSETWAYFGRMMREGLTNNLGLIVNDINKILDPISQESEKTFEGIKNNTQNQSIKLENVTFAGLKPQEPNPLYFPLSFVPTVEPLQIPLTQNKVDPTIQKTLINFKIKDLLKEITLLKKTLKTEIESFSGTNIINAMGNVPKETAEQANVSVANIEQILDQVKALETNKKTKGSQELLTTLYLIIKQLRLEKISLDNLKQTILDSNINKTENKGKELFSLFNYLQKIRQEDPGMTELSTDLSEPVNNLGQVLKKELNDLNTFKENISNITNKSQLELFIKNLKTVTNSFNEQKNVLERFKKITITDKLTQIEPLIDSIKTQINSLNPITSKKVKESVVPNFEKTLTQLDDLKASALNISDTTELKQFLDTLNKLTTSFKKQKITLDAVEQKFKAIYAHPNIQQPKQNLTIGTFKPTAEKPNIPFYKTLSDFIPDSMIEKDLANLDTPNINKKDQFISSIQINRLIPLVNKFLTANSNIQQPKQTIETFKPTAEKINVPEYKTHIQQPKQSLPIETFKPTTEKPNIPYYKTLSDFIPDSMIEKDLANLDTPNINTKDQFISPLQINKTISLFGKFFPEALNMKFKTLVTKTHGQSIPGLTLLKTAPLDIATTPLVPLNQKLGTGKHIFYENLAKDEAKKIETLQTLLLDKLESFANTLGSVYSSKDEMPADLAKSMNEVVDGITSKLDELRIIKQDQLKVLDQASLINFIKTIRQVTASFKEQKKGLDSFEKQINVISSAKISQENQKTVERMNNEKIENIVSSFQNYLKRLTVPEFNSVTLKPIQPKTSPLVNFTNEEKPLIPNVTFLKPAVTPFTPIIPLDRKLGIENVFNKQAGAAIKKVEKIESILKRQTKQFADIIDTIYKSSDQMPDDLIKAMNESVSSIASQLDLIDELKGNKNKVLDEASLINFLKTIKQITTSFKEQKKGLDSFEKQINAISSAKISQENQKTVEIEPEIVQFDSSNEQKQSIPNATVLTPTSSEEDIDAELQQAVNNRKKKNKQPQAEPSINMSEEPIEEVSESIQRQLTLMERLKVFWTSITEKVKETRRNFTRAIVEDYFEALNDKLQKFLDQHPKISSFFETFKNNLVNISKMAISFLLLNKAKNILDELLPKSIELAINLQLIQTRLDFTTKGMGTQILQELKQFSNELGVNFQASAEGVSSFLAASIGGTIESQALRMSKQLIKGMAVFGLDKEAQEGVFTAVSQIAGKGKLSAEEIRGQLGERLPGAFNIGARSMGITVQQFDKLMSAGNIPSEEFLPKFMKQLELETSTGLVAGTQTLRSELNRLENNITNIQTTLGSNFIMTFVAPLKIINQILGSISKNFQGIFEILVSTGIVLTTVIITGMIRFFSQFRGGLLIRILQTIKNNLLETINVFNTLTNKPIVLSNWGANLFPKKQIWLNAINTAKDVLLTLPSQILPKVGAFFSGISEGAIALYRKLQGVSRVEPVSAVATITPDVTWLQSLINKAKALPAFFAGIWNTIATSFSQMITTLTTTFQSGFIVTMQGFSNLLLIKIKEFVAVGIQTVGTFFTSLKIGITSLYTFTIRSIASIATAIVNLIALLLPLIVLITAIFMLIKGLQLAYRLTFGAGTKAIKDQTKAITDLLNQIRLLNKQAEKLEDNRAWYEKNAVVQGWQVKVLNPKDFAKNTKMLNKALNDSVNIRTEIGLSKKRLKIEGMDISLQLREDDLNKIRNKLTELRSELNQKKLTFALISDTNTEEATKLKAEIASLNDRISTLMTQPKELAMKISFNIENLNALIEATEVYLKVQESQSAQYIGNKKAMEDYLIQVNSTKQLLQGLRAEREKNISIEKTINTYINENTKLYSEQIKILTQFNSKLANINWQAEFIPDEQFDLVLKRIQGKISQTQFDFQTQQINVDINIKKLNDIKSAFAALDEDLQTKLDKLQPSIKKQLAEQLNVPSIEEGIQNNSLSVESIQQFRNSPIEEVKNLLEQNSNSITPMLEVLEKHIEITRLLRQQEFELMTSFKDQRENLKSNREELLGFIRSIEDFQLSIDDFYRQRTNQLVDFEFQYISTLRDNKRNIRNLIQQYEDLTNQLNKELQQYTGELKVGMKRLASTTTLNNLRKQLNFGAEGIFSGILDILESFDTSSLSYEEQLNSVNQERLQIELDIVSQSRQVRDMSEAIADYELQRLQTLRDLVRAQDEFVLNQLNSWRGIVRQGEDMYFQAENMGFIFTSIVQLFSDAQSQLALSVQRLANFNATLPDTMSSNLTTGDSGINNLGGSGEKIIGKIGDETKGDSVGLSTGNHLHITIKKGNTKLDPFSKETIKILDLIQMGGKPLTQLQPSSPFGPRKGKMHRGVDYGAGTTQPNISTTGTITSIKHLLDPSGYGNYIKMKLAEFPDYTIELGHLANETKQIVTNLKSISSLNTTQSNNYIAIATKLLKEKEGFRARAYPDTNGYRIGYGTEFKGNKASAYNAQSTITQQEAEKQLVQFDIPRFTKIVQKQIGTLWNSLSESTKASLVSIAYNKGSLTPAMVNAIKQQNLALLKQTILNTDSKTHRTRRHSEASLITGNTSKLPTIPYRSPSNISIPTFSPQNQPQQLNKKPIVSTEINKKTDYKPIVHESTADIQALIKLLTYNQKLTQAQIEQALGFVAIGDTQKAMEFLTKQVANIANYKKKLANMKAEQAYQQMIKDELGIQKQINQKRLEMEEGLRSSRTSLINNRIQFIKNQAEMKGFTSAYDTMKFAVIDAVKANYDFSQSLETEIRNLDKLIDGVNLSNTELQSLLDTQYSNGMMSKETYEGYKALIAQGFSYQEVLQKIKSEYESLKNATDKNKDAIIAFRTELALLEANIRRLGEFSSIYSGIAEIAKVSGQIDLSTRLSLKANRLDNLVKMQTILKDIDNQLLEMKINPDLYDEKTEKELLHLKSNLAIMVKIKIDKEEFDRKKDQIISQMNEFKTVLATIGESKNKVDFGSGNTEIFLSKILEVKAKFTELDKQLDTLARNSKDAFNLKLIQDYRNQLDEMEANELQRIKYELSDVYKFTREPLKTAFTSLLTDFVKGTATLSDIFSTLLNNIASKLVDFWVESNLDKMLMGLLDTFDTGDYGTGTIDGGLEIAQGIIDSNSRGYAPTGFDVDGVNLDVSNLVYTNEDFISNLDSLFDNKLLHLEQVLSTNSLTKETLNTDNLFQPLEKTIFGGFATFNNSMNGLMSNIVGSVSNTLINGLAGGLGFGGSGGLLGGLFGLIPKIFGFQEGGLISDISNFQEGGLISDIANFKEGGLISDIANFKDGGMVSNEIVNFKKGGMVKINNYADGGKIKNALALAFGVQKAIKKEGTGAVPIVANNRERVLNPSDTIVFNELLNSGKWQQIKENKIANFNEGGLVSTVSKPNFFSNNNSQSSQKSEKTVIVNRQTSINVTTPNVDSFRASKTQIAYQQSLADKRNKKLS